MGEGVWRGGERMCGGIVCEGRRVYVWGKVCVRRGERMCGGRCV